jgi:hypothetical protein
MRVLLPLLCSLLLAGCITVQQPNPYDGYTYTTVYPLAGLVVPYYARPTYRPVYRTPWTAFYPHNSYGPYLGSANPGGHR